MTRTAQTGIRVAGHGLSVTVHHPWEARLYLRPAPGDATAVPANGAHPAARGWPGELTHPVLHLANFSLPAGRGDFGTGAVELMGAEDVFVCLFEYDRAEAGQPLFAGRGLPRPGVAEFSASSLQRRLTGQAGCQRFFHQDGRAFCLYVVLGSVHRVGALVPQLHTVLDQLRIGEP